SRCLRSLGTICRDLAAFTHVPRARQLSYREAPRLLRRRGRHLAETAWADWRNSMDATALLLSRLQFAFTISFDIIFPAFSIGLAAWLAVLEAKHRRTGNAVYRTLFQFWLKIFGVAFGLGVVSGIVMAFQFGTNWSVLSNMSGPIQGPLLSYE